MRRARRAAKRAAAAAGGLFWALALAGGALAQEREGGFLRFRDKPVIRRVQPPPGVEAEPEPGDLWLDQAGEALSSPLILIALGGFVALVFATVLVRHQVAQRRHRHGDASRQRRREALARDLASLRRAREGEVKPVRRWEDAG